MKEKHENGILISNINNEVYLKVSGHVTANLSFPIREHLFKRINTLKIAITVYIDLSETDYMDSTFMGLLIGIEKKLSSIFKNHLYIINPSKVVKNQLESMKLNLFLKIEEKEIPDSLEWFDFNNCVVINEIEKSKMILIAHDDLCEINKENQERFQYLQEILKKQIEEKEKENNNPS